MAAACSVSEYEHAAWPYLERPGNETTHFYHVILHDVSELKEAHLREIPPRGSLLVWIDDFFSHPVVPRDRTAGRFNNLMSTLKNTPERIRPQVAVKIFGLGAYPCPGGQSCPQQHDQFTNQRFWCDDLWTPAAPGWLDVDNALCDGFEITSIDNIIRYHTTKNGFAAVIDEKTWKEFYKATGEPWVHIKEMRGSILDLEMRINILKDSLNHSKHTGKQRTRVTEAINKRVAIVEEMKQAVE
jgi:hypothetical protein